MSTVAFILVIMLTANGRPAVATQEFTSAKNCEVAKEAIKKAWGNNWSICVPK